MNNTTNIVIDDGLKNITFSNKNNEVFAEFSFNPADTSIIERYEKVVDAFNDIKLDGDEKEVQEKIIALSNNLKEQFDYLLNRNVSEGLFKTYSPVTVFASGEFFAEIILEQIAKIIEAEYDIRLKKKAKKIEKYTKKYHK